MKETKMVSLLKNLNETKMVKLFNKLNETNVEFMLTCMDDISDELVMEGSYKKFKDCENNNLISEATLNRLLDFHKRGCWCIITAYRDSFKKPDNIKRNRILRGILNNHKMGVHQLVGHWRECTLDGVPYDKCPIDKLKDVIERSYFVPKPDDIPYEEFKKIMIELMTIDGSTQDSILLYDGEEIKVYGSRGEVFSTYKNLSLNKIAQAYSQHVKKLDVPFIFEGVEIPGSISGRRVMASENIRYLV